MKSKSLIMAGIAICALLLISLTAYASSKSGCITKGSASNNGKCVNDGTNYFCMSAKWYNRKDCIKGIYPEGVIVVIPEDPNN